MTPCQTFKARVVELVDQAQHFAAIGAGGSGGGGPSGDVAQAFREGLDATERESESMLACNLTCLTTPVFQSSRLHKTALNG